MKPISELVVDNITTATYEIPNANALREVREIYYDDLQGEDAEAYSASYFGYHRSITCEYKLEIDRKNRIARIIETKTHEDEDYRDEHIRDYQADVYRYINNN
jgi:hypothetical protein